MNTNMQVKLRLMPCILHPEMMERMVAEYAGLSRLIVAETVDYAKGGLVSEDGMKLIIWDLTGQGFLIEYQPTECITVKRVRNVFRTAEAV